MMKYINWLRVVSKRKLFFGILLLFLVLKILFFSDSIFPGTITEAYFCTPSQSHNKIEHITLESAQNLLVCGYLSTVDGRPASMVVYVWAPGNALVSEKAVYITPGNIAIPIEPVFFRTGQYRVLITDNKEQIVEFYFEIEK